MYCPLLESLGVETAFITIPGHIYVAFALDMTPEQARSAFKYPDELIFREGDSWVPVEVTLRDQGFLAAWQQGAKEWREYNQVEQAGFYPVHEGWDVYTPVGLPGSANLNSLDSNEIVEEFSEELLAFVDREIAAEVASVQVRMDAQPRDPRWPNRLGIVYARYGVDSQAVKYFEQALELRSDYAPAMVNLGNIHYLQGNLFKALDYYEAAQSRAPDDPRVLLNIARANHEIENYGTARRAYSQLQEVSPSLANRFAYLGLRGEEAARAAQAGDVEGVILWSDEGGEE
jgi:tetratricopeptide (TPR) repeat protein